MTLANTKTTTNVPVHRNIIARRFIVYIAIGSISITIVMSIISLLIKYQIELGNIEKRNNTLSRTIIPTLVNSLWIADKTQIKIILDGIRNTPSISYLEIQSEQGYFSSGKNRPNDAILHKHNLKYKYNNKIVRLGTLIIHYNLQHVYSNLFFSGLNTLIVHAITVLSLSVIVSIIFQHILGKHLTHISDYVRNFREKKSNAPLVLDRKFRKGISTHDELENMTDAINSMAKNISRAIVEKRDFIKELEEKNMELEQFTYTVSHDLQSPLVTIKGYIGLLRRDIEISDQVRIVSDLERIDAAAEHMRNLLHDLLELSRIGRKEAPQEILDMSALAQSAVEQLSDPSIRNNFAIDVESNMSHSYGEPSRIREVFQNLIENAIKYSRHQEYPHIAVSEIERDGVNWFCIKDNGIGIEPQYHNNIFGLFERLDSTTEGTGIGLAIVKRIIELHNGEIRVESEGAGKGTAFLFRMPEPPA